MYRKKIFKKCITKNQNLKQRKVFPIVVGQCSPSLRSQLEGTPNFLEIYKKNNIVWLLKIIRGFCCNHDQNNDNVCAVMNSLRLLFINFQKSDVSNDDYLKEFQARVATIDNYNANILDLIPCLLEDEVKEKFNKDSKSANEVELRQQKKALKRRLQQLYYWLGLTVEGMVKWRTAFNKTWLWVQIIIQGPLTKWWMCWIHLPRQVKG